MAATIDLTRFEAVSFDCFGTVWVNRRDAASGPGEARADLTVASLAELATLVESAFTRSHPAGGPTEHGTTP